MEKQQGDKGLDTSVMPWLHHLQPVMKTISIAHMLFAYL